VCVFVDLKIRLLRNGNFLFSGICINLEVGQYYGEVDYLNYLITVVSGRPGVD